MATLLLQAGVVFAVVALGGAVATRVDQSVIPAYIVAGILVGPEVPDLLGVPFVLVESQEFITLLSELGIVFLLFFIGLEFNLDRLLASRSQIASAGTIDLLVNGVVGLGLALLFGFGPVEALFLAGIVYISSSAIITKTLIDLEWIADPETEAILGTLVFEDVVIAVYLALLSALVLGGGGSSDTLFALGRAGAVLVALVLLAFYGTGLLERILSVRSDEQFLLRVVGSAVLVGGVALSMGVSEAVAAFFLGAAFGGTEHAERIERVITSERDLYAAVFFFAIGLATDPSVVLEVATPLAALVVATVASKLVSGYLGGQRYGLSKRRSIRVALAMVARGEFSLVLAALAASAGTTPALRETIPALAVGYVLVMSVVGTTLMRYSHVVERWAGTPQKTVAGR
ncbi:cation:proton antiporter [Haloarculaceae archaeon H-GB1-1]|nr:cation:proton antiporter [Haloarculaceae archaeon H-GB1-1]